MLLLLLKINCLAHWVCGWLKFAFSINWEISWMAFNTLTQSFKHISTLGSLNDFSRLLINWRVESAIRIFILSLLGSYLLKLWNTYIKSFLKWKLANRILRFLVKSFVSLRFESALFKFRWDYFSLNLRLLILWGHICQLTWVWSLRTNYWNWIV